MRPLALEKELRERIKICIDLGYGYESIQKLKQCETDHEMDRVMMQARMNL